MGDLGPISSWLIVVMPPCSAINSSAVIVVGEKLSDTMIDDQVSICARARAKVKSRCEGMPVLFDPICNMHEGLVAGGGGIVNDDTMVLVDTVCQLWCRCISGSWKINSWCLNDAGRVGGS